jgi:hypothetical protein
MFTEMVTRSDAFLDMPTSTQALYFHLLSEADDDGFVASPKMVMRIVGATSDEISMLIGKKFIIPFNGGVCVIKHWRMHNQVRKDRYTETKYRKEKLSLYIRGNGAYTTNPEGAVPVPSGFFTMENIDKMLLATNWQPTVALGKGRLGEDNKSEQSSLKTLEDNKEDMAWKKYNENDHSDDTPAIDLDSGEKIPSADDLLKEKNDKKLRYKKDLVEWLITHQQIDRVKITQPWRNKQYKALEELWVMHTPRPKIIQTIVEYEKADWYKGGRPDFRSIVSKFEKEI